jgi:hypothetical protein
MTLVWMNHILIPYFTASSNDGFTGFFSTTAYSVWGVFCRISVFLVISQKFQSKSSSVNFSVFAKVCTEIDLSEVNLDFGIDKNDN